MNELGHAWAVINPPVNLNHKCILRSQVYHLHFEFNPSSSSKIEYPMYLMPMNLLQFP